MAENLQPTSEQEPDTGFPQAAKLLAGLNEAPRPAIPMPRAPKKRPELQQIDLANKLRPIYQEGTQSEHGHNEPQIQELAEQYQLKYPNELEAITILTNVQSFLELTQRVKDPELKREEKKPLFKELTEYQYLWTHFVITNSDKTRVMEDFWEATHRIAESAGYAEPARAYQSGIITAAATYQIFEALGKQPQLSHPAEDAYDAIDLWIDETNQPVQIKKSNASEVEIEKTEDIEFPALEVAGPAGHTQHFAIEQPNREQIQFKMNIKRYAERVGHPVDGYFIRVPYGQVDSTTGKPTPELIEQVRAKLAAEEPEAA